MRGFTTGCSRVILFYDAAVSDCHGAEWLVTFDSLLSALRAPVMCACTSRVFTEVCLPACQNIHLNKSFNLSKYQRSLKLDEFCDPLSPFAPIFHMSCLTAFLQPFHKAPTINLRMMRLNILLTGLNLWSLKNHILNSGSVEGVQFSACFLQTWQTILTIFNAYNCSKTIAQ